MSRGRSGGIFAGIALASGVLGAAVVKFPIDVLVNTALVLVFLALCVAVLMGAKPASGTLLKWAVALCIIATTWPAVSTRVRQGLDAAVQGGLPHGVRPASGSLDGFLYDLTTLLVLALLLLLSAGVLLLSSRIRAGLRPTPAPPRPQARRRARLVDPRGEIQLPAPGTEPQAADPQAADDFGLLGDDRGR